MILLMGIFAFYCGFIYNDMMSLPLDLFGTCYRNLATYPASNDGIVWDYLPDASNTTTRITTTDYINNSGSYKKTIKSYFWRG
jgi:hypothetical protein